MRIDERDEIGAIRNPVFVGPVVRWLTYMWAHTCFFYFLHVDWDATLGKLAIHTTIPLISKSNTLKTGSLQLNPSHSSNQTHSKRSDRPNNHLSVSNGKVIPNKNIWSSVVCFFLMYDVIDFDFLNMFNDSSCCDNLSLNIFYAWFISFLCLQILWIKWMVKCIYKKANNVIY